MVDTSAIYTCVYIQIHKPMRTTLQCIHKIHVQKNRFMCMLPGVARLTYRDHFRLHINPHKPGQIPYKRCGDSYMIPRQLHIQAMKLHGILGQPHGNPTWATTSFRMGRRRFQNRAIRDRIHVLWADSRGNASTPAARASMAAAPWRS